MPFGQSRYEEINSLLNAKFAEKKTLICAHRGSWHGNVIQNTTLAYRAALMQGADIVETDTTATRDGEVFSLHVPGTPDSLKGDAALSAAVDAVVREANNLGVKVVK